MLLNTWLSAARNHFSRPSATRRVVRAGSRQSLSSESLEARTLLTALVINPDNKADFVNAFGGVVVNNLKLGTHDSLIIEGILISATSGDALSINLSGVTLKSLALESITVSQYGTLGFNIDLTNVTGLHTLAIEDITMQGTARGLDLTMTNTDTDALTIDDSTIPGIRIDALNGGDIGQGLITQSTIAAGSGVEGVLLNVNQGTADNFRIEDNPRISSPNRDFVRINSTNAPIDGLSIVNNQIGNQTQGAGIVFRADGDTFVQPMVLSNNSTQGEFLQTFVLDLTSIGLEFDENATTGKAFTPTPASAATTGLLSNVVSPDGTTLTVTFSDFAPGETLSFVIDIDLAGGIPTSVFGDDLIGADVQATLTGNRVVAGQMIGDPNKITASQFAIGPGVAGATHGINLNLTNSPTTNVQILGNSVGAAPGHGLLIDARGYSDVTGVITNNQFFASGRDGIRFSMVDSNFAGAVIGNNIANNGENGVSILPSVTRTGLVERLLDTNPVMITTTNHGLQTGDQIMLQGVVNDDPSINHPANGLHSITRIDNNRFQLNLVNGLGPGVLYAGGGAWYVPDFRSDGSIRGLVTVDMQASIPQGTIRAATNASPIVITSPNHGLTSGQRVRVSNVAGNTAANGVKKVTFIDADTFSLDATVGNGVYDPTVGFGTWTGNVVTNAANSPSLIITSPGHGLQTGEEIRVTGVLGNTAANGTFRVSVINADTFRLDTAVGNGVYGGGGNWVRLNDTTFTGDRIPQRVSGNLITGNKKTGFLVNLGTGTIFNGDIVGNTVSQNLLIGINIESHSFGLGTDLPLDPDDPLALPGLQDISFDVNIGTSAAGDGNLLDGNTQAGIVIEALDHGTGSFEIRNNRIVSSKDDGLSTTPYAGDGIVVRLTDDVIPADAISLLSKSVIDGNIIGVDNQGNQGNGLLFTLNQRTRLQDLQLTNNTFLNNGLDGFHFERSEDADLNAVVAEKNKVTNNLGDGFSLLATNTVKDKLDFRLNENVIDNNGEYGLRIDVKADARIAVQFDRNTVTGNGHTRAGGFHPDDGVPGSFQTAGGIGILAFQQVDVDFMATDTHIDNNIGDGFSTDAFYFFDTLKVNTTLTNVTLNGNSLTGYRSHGAAFGDVRFFDSNFDGNGEDGVRFASIEDKTDFFERRVGGMDISVFAQNNSFSDNVQSGVQLGQGVSAVFGDGTIPNANFFDGNGEDGLKITQSAGPHLEAMNSNVSLGVTSFLYARRRHIEASTNFFRNNLGDGIDIGHFAETEGGNVEHGDEVVTDVQVSINNATITGNQGDGVEYLADSVLRLSPIVGGGQDVEYNHQSSLTISDSRIASNKKRGVDILNRHGEDSFINLINNQILSNRFEGVYVLNTASHYQLQTGPTDPLIPYIEQITVRDDDDQRFFSVGTKQREVDFEISPHIEFRAQDNLIESNGTTTVSSVVPVNLSTLGVADENGTPSAAWTHQFTNVQGTLGGIVLRVGAVDTAGRFTNFFTDAERPGLYVSNPAWELGLAGIDAEIFRNTFDGNIGTDVYIDSFTSQIPAQSRGNFNPPTEGLIWDVAGYRDPLSRIDLVFRENIGNSLDLTNGFAFIDNRESEFKSRSVNSFSTNHIHANDPDGPWNDGGPYRFRNQQRTMGYFNLVGDDPGVFPYFWDVRTEGPPRVHYAYWSFDGWGTSTWRVERDSETLNFPNTNSTLGQSDLFDIVDISIQGDSTQWDTGRDLPGFTGDTDWSLDRGDVFNVGFNLDPIVADSLEENDSFVGATDLGTVSGAGYSVNSLATNNTLSLHTKADRDYYHFVAGGTGAISVNLNVTDAGGDRLVFMLYEVNPILASEERAVNRAANGAPIWVVASPGQGAATLSYAGLEAGKEYIIEVFGTERENVFQSVFEAEGTLGKSFFYGTARTYQLSIDAPAAAPAPPAFSGGGSNSGGESNSGSFGGSASGAAPGGGGGWNGNLPGQTPTVSFVPVAPDPRNTSVSLVTLNFSEDVTGVDILDFQLKRGSVIVPLTASMLTQVDAMQYTLNPGTVTGDAGTYVISIFALNSGIKDSDNNLLTAGNTDSWVVSNTVNTVLDTPDTSPGDSLSRDISGKASLRASVMESNLAPGSDVITLGSFTYTLTRAGRFEDESLLGDLDIRGGLTIRGVSAAATIINAADLDRIFHVFPGASLTLENLTVTGGEAFDGGGIFNEGTLILRHVNVIRNEAYNQGGGIFNAGTLTVVGSSISENLAGSRGGAVNNIGTATYTSTTISTNVAVSRGGGLFNEGTAASTMTNVSLIANRSSSRGGGLASESPLSTKIGNSILERNAVETKVANSNATIGRDMFGGVSSQGFNTLQILDSKYDTAAAAGLLVSDRFGRDTTAMSVALPDFTNVLQYGAGNGVGFHALKPKGGAVDVGSNSLYPFTPVQNQLDAIRNPRLIDGNADGIYTIDLGAVEHFVSKPSANFVANPNPVGLNADVTFDGRNSAHPDPVNGAIVKWEWDFDWNPTGLLPTKPLTDPAYDPTEYFTQDDVGSVVTHKYTDPSRTTYIVRLIVTDTFNNKGFVDQTIVVGLPLKPVVQRPFAVTSDLTPEIRWQASPAKYRLELFNVTSGSRVVVLNVPNLTSTSYTPTTNLTPGRYEVIITSTNTSGNTPSDSYFFDVTRLALTAPQGSTFDTTPKFTWAAIPGSTRYDLWLDRTQPEYTDQLLRNEFISGTTFETTTSLGLGTFSWWVRAYDADGVAGDWSVPKTFTIGRASLTAPAAVTMNTKPKFTWTNMGAPRYELWVNQIGGKVKVIYQPALQTNSFTPTTALPNGDFEAWVRPLSSDGEAGLWSLVHNFRMDYRIGPVTISPVGITTDTTPTFTWQPIDGAAKYDLWVDNLTTAVKQFIRVDVPHVVGTSPITYTHPVSLNAGNYRWWVQAVSSTGARTAWSAAVNFTIPVPGIINPRGPIGTNLPLFTFSGVAQYVKYDLWVDNLTTGAKQVLRVQDIMTTSYKTLLPFENGTFRAWVRGIDILGNLSQWSGPADFSISVGVGSAPIALNPSGTINDTTPTFSWRAGTNAVTHEILVKRIDDPAQPIVINVRNLLGTSYTTTITLPPGHTYRWWIRGLDIDGNGLPWSQPLDFRVVSNDGDEGQRPSDPYVPDVAIPAVLVVNAGDWSDDEGVRSITAHPAGTIVQMTPGTVDDRDAREIPVTPAEDVTGIDSFMEEWAATALFIESEFTDTSPASALPVSPVPTVVTQTSDKDRDAINLLMAGIVAGAVLGRRKQSDKDNETN